MRISPQAEAGFLQYPPILPTVAATRIAKPQAKTRAKNTPVIDPQAVLLRIRLIVQQYGSVREVAEKCGLPVPSLETYVKGQNLPGTLAIASLCHGLSVSADWLLFGEVAR